MAAAWMPSPVLALEADPVCVMDAVAAKKECKARCKDDFLVSKDECRNVDHACADACRAGRSTCYDGPLSVLDACIAQCNTGLDAAKTGCRTQVPPLDPVALDQCIDAVQLAACTCRDNCREALERDTLKLCRKAFHECMRTCPSATAN